ncbi:MAG: TolC family protein [Bdellovibrionota bacterium]
MKTEQHSICKAFVIGASLLAIGASSIAKGQTAKTPPAKAQAKSQARVGTLMLETYLQQVRTQNGQFASAAEMEQGAKSRADEWKLLTRPNLIGQYIHSEDYRESGSTALPSASRAKTYFIGLQQQFEFGMQATLKYGVVDAEAPGINTAFGQPMYTTAGPSLELKQSLWRNFLGNETEATQEKLMAASELTKYRSSFEQTQLLTSAEAAYWRLALAREAVAATQETYDRAVRLRDWSARRRGLELADRSDLLQADSALLNRQLELQRSLDEEKSAARNFNTFRAQAEDTVAENLLEFDGASIDKLALPARVQFREDTLAEEQSMRLAQAVAKEGLERNKPTVDLIGGVAFTGRDVNHEAAMNEGWPTKNPNYSVGVVLNMPLDIGTSSAVRDGYRREVAAADVAFKQKVFQQERLWEDVVQRFQDSVARFRIATKMEASQREKLDYERVRQGRGRTTTYQVILFEQDFANAALSRIQAQAEVLNAYAQLKTFRGEQ